MRGPVGRPLALGIRWRVLDKQRGLNNCPPPGGAITIQTDRNGESREIQYSETAHQFKKWPEKKKKEEVGKGGRLANNSVIGESTGGVLRRVIKLGIEGRSLGVRKMGAMNHRGEYGVPGYNFSINVG